MTFLPNLILDNALGNAFDVLKAAHATTPLSLRWAEVLTAALLPAASLLILQPLEMARIRLAADRTMAKFCLCTGEEVTHKGYMDGGECPMQKENGKKHQGVLDALDSIVRKEGFKGIYRTFFLALAGLLLFKWSSKALNDQLVSHLTDPDELAKVGVAAASTVIAGLLTYPLETVRARLAVDTGDKDAKFDGVWDAAKKIFTEEELSSFYAGAQVSLLYLPLGFAPFAFRSLTRSLGLNGGEFAVADVEAPPVETIVAAAEATAAAVVDAVAPEE